MTDILSKTQRSALMRRIRGRDTRPELIVRKLAHSLGYRFRLHKKSLPGSPDLVFPFRRKIIFVHGCFWHGHECRRNRHPKSRPDYWAMRFAKNKERDQRNLSALNALGWSVLVIWECETADTNHLSRRLVRFLG